MVRATRKRVRVGRPPGPQADPAVRREQLLEAAARAIRRNGSDVSMERLAAEAGLTKPILYTHFGDKAGLASALAERFATDIVRTVFAGFSDGADGREVVRKAIDIFVGFVEEEPEIYRFLVRGAIGSDNGFVEQRLVVEMGTQLAQVLHTQLHAANADTGAAEVWAFAILGLVFAGGEWWTLRATMTRHDLVEYLTSLAWGGLSGGLEGTNR